MPPYIDISNVLGQRATASPAKIVSPIISTGETLQIGGIVFSSGDAPDASQPITVKFDPPVKRVSFLSAVLTAPGAYALGYNVYGNIVSAFFDSTTVPPREMLTALGIPVSQLTGYPTIPYQITYGNPVQNVDLSESAPRYDGTQYGPTFDLATFNETIATVKLVPGINGHITYGNTQITPVPLPPGDALLPDPTPVPIYTVTAPTPPTPDTGGGVVGTGPITDRGPVDSGVYQFLYAINTKITVRRLSISILDSLLAEARTQIAGTYITFLDDERNTKLLLNFGSDYQKVIVNQKLASEDNSKLVVKLLTPLEPFVTTGQPVFISREVAKTTIEKIKIEIPPLLNPNPWLRPKIRHARF